MQTIDTFTKYLEINDQQLDQAYNTALMLVKNNIPQFFSCFPTSSSTDNFYGKSDNVEWTTGFWTGEIWLAYEGLKDPSLMQAGEIQVESFLNRILNKIDTDHHDMGFLYSPSCVAAFMLTGSGKAKKAALLAADNLMERFHEKGQFFQAWGNLNDKNNYRLIIDCLMNMPLLFWAADQTGKKEYAQKAEAHIKTAMQLVCRPDYSTYHTYFFDMETGAPVYGATHQGYRDGSAWARGQAWGIYGSAISYKYLKDEEYIKTFKQLTDYFLQHLPKDLIPYWDFEFSDGSSQPRDSSASAIAICGMLEMSSYLPQVDAEYYVGIAKRLLKALIDNCSVEDAAQSNGLLLHGTYAKSSPYNPCTDVGVDECNLWGDYYYLEALTRLHKKWLSYW